MGRSIARDAAEAAVGIWLFLHFVLFALAQLGFTRITLVGIPLIVSVVVMLDQRACRETVILGNLGVPTSVAPISAGLVAILLESFGFLVFA